MSSLDRRIEKLEQKFGKREPRVIIVSINPNNHPEDPRLIELSPGGMWAYAVRGGPFTDEEIQRLKAEEMCRLKEEYQGQ